MAGSNDVGASLDQLIRDLSIAIENKSESVLQNVEEILALLKRSGVDSVPDVSMIPNVQLVLLLRWQSSDVVANVANILAEVAKSEIGRERLATLQPPISHQLVSLLQQKSSDLSAEGSISVSIQVCRALGNMCYESERGQKCVLDASGLEVLVMLLEKSVLLSSSVLQARLLRSVIVGSLLNLTVSQNDKHKQLVDLGGIGLLCRVLELDGQTEDGCDVANHVITVLGYLLKHVPEGDVVLTDKVCLTLVQALSTFSSSSVEICESVLQLLIGHANDDAVQRSLAHAGLCQLLILLVEKHQSDIEEADEEAQQLLKMATDLIVIVLNEDSGMTMLFQSGKGEVYLSMRSWLKAEQVHIRTTAVLALGNFARCDNHCILMVGAGVHEEILDLIKGLQGQDLDTQQEFELLSLLAALRNISIPSSNKPIILNAGAMSSLIPFLNTSEPMIVYRLFASLRMLVDGQEKAAEELGRNKDVIHKLAEWGSTDTHVVGAQAEASRLLASIIKNTRSKEVAVAVVECNALPPLVAMLSSEHATMRNEALLALTLISAKHLSQAQPSLAEAKVGVKVASMLSQHGTSMEKPMLVNVLSLLGELVTSDVLVKHLVQSGVTESLTGLTSSRKDISDLDALVLKLATALNIS